MKTLTVILSVIVLASCGPVSSEDSVLRSVLGSLVNCNSDFTLCMKEHALKAADRLNAARKIKLIDGVTLLNTSPKESKSLDTLSSEPDVRNKQVSERLWQSTSDLFQSAELELSYGGDDGEGESRSIDDEVEEGRGKKKKQLKKKLKVLIPLVLLAKAKAVALVVLSLVVIAASLFKLALLAKIAFIIKIVALIKSLLAKKNSQEEISWQPQASGWESMAHVEHHPVAVEHAGHGWEQGWSRSRNEANNMAYSAYGAK
ncbi:uncharacterized protein LOC142983724 [Anticarsia gemmatalis]|uniref:uncharacterized protein LOC142983724 n=1 Tax=Anticarsia gemmatalis TaxID=129554 RepID=UPI003F765CCD